MLCPVCNVDLMMSDRNGVEIDYCPKCRGVWLDRGELDKIIERSTTTSYNQSYNSHSQYDHHNNYYKKKKRESWLGEIFDF
ncbi:zf-TFIIB domain-containing protein [Campylobacter novaezeelandiae]|uniref:TFIIB-type zinc ribbon-containing protein n=1 Tax=Campylobacter novaezeelandiae TaxID=2267891 RepID=UPI0019067E64|nr:zf-TFIIB domain-containing protein [Campylobacter novaezeelandiae]MBK1964810.1 zf-TFIIB domain-containing protein [Campylobacter novaezeelandiae]MBK1964813.1 zf-TFIIB domain-containing protein [Campylobacter novaezeelandiae]MBK1993047.1 zf-TFIIB domain-containing protein [Campylobacter novaezeelandiae]